MNRYGSRVKGKMLRTVLVARSPIERWAWAAIFVGTTRIIGQITNG